MRSANGSKPSGPRRQQVSKSDVYEIVLRPMMAVFSPPPRSITVDESAALEEYAGALSRFDSADLKTGWQRVREAHKRAFWPPIGILVEACNAARRNRFAGQPNAIHGRMVSGKIEQWGGACRCKRCVERVSGPEFFHAPAEVHAAARAEEEADNTWWRARFGNTNETIRRH